MGNEVVGKSKNSNNNDIINFSEIIKENSEILKEQTKTLNEISKISAEVSRSVVEADKFRTEKSSLWQEVKTIKNEILDFSIILRGDGKDHFGIANEVSILKEKSKELNGVYITLNARMIGIENDIRNVSRDVDVLKNTDKSQDKKIDELCDFMSQTKNVRNSIKMLWTGFVALISAVATIITIFFTLSNK